MILHVDKMLKYGGLVVLSLATVLLFLLLWMTLQMILLVSGV
jgi:hypothetical protein